jgi:phosphate transport system protein
MAYDKERGAPMGMEPIRSRGMLDREEREIKDGILRMGSLVEDQIRRAIDAIVRGDAELARAVVADDARVNDAQRGVDELILATIATQSPVARDLRFLLALARVGAELERIGDHASGIAKQVARIDGPLPAAADLAAMGSLAADQVRGIIAALITGDVALARAVAAKDDDIDLGYKTVFVQAVERMQADPSSIDRGTRLILAAHWIERIGDRVTNVAEDIVYLATGTVEDLNP